MRALVSGRLLATLKRSLEESHMTSKRLKYIRTHLALNVVRITPTRLQQETTRTQIKDSTRVRKCGAASEKVIYKRGEMSLRTC